MQTLPAPERSPPRRDRPGRAGPPSPGQRCPLAAAGGSAGRPALPSGSTWGWIPRRGPAWICPGTQVPHVSCPEPRGQRLLQAAAASDTSRWCCLRHWELLVTPHFDWVKYFPTPGRVFAQEGSVSHVCCRSLCTSRPMSLVPGRQFLMYINMC